MNSRLVIRRAHCIVSLLLVSLVACGKPMSEAPKKIAGYGTWDSPLTAARVTAGALRLDQIQLDGEDVYWVEGRAAEGGRNVIVRRTPNGIISDVTPPGFNVRSRVHEYEIGRASCRERV